MYLKNCFIETQAIVRSISWVKNTYNSMWNSSHDLEVLRKKIKESVERKGFEILRSEVLLDLGSDLVAGAISELC